MIKRIPKVDGELGWFETASNYHIEIGQRLKGKFECDYLILGAGYTGISLAHRLAELYPDAKIAIIDALRIGQGTSGRNAGFIIDLPHNLDAGEPDLEADQYIYRLNSFSIQRLKNFKDEFNIDCRWHDAGKYLTAHEESNFSGLNAFKHTLDASKFEYQELEGRELAQRLGTSYYKKAIYTPGNVLMNPAALIRGVALGLPKNVHIFEQSPVLTYHYGSTHTLKTLGGVIHAKTLVQCTNSYTEEFGEVSNRLAPVFTYASLTRPLSETEFQQYFSRVQPWGLTSAHPAGTTLRFTPDRRIFVRNVLDFEPALQSRPEGLTRAWEQHRLSFEARFPQLKDLVFEYTWGGMLCMTMNHQSVFKQAADNLFVIGGCNGVGVAKGTYLGYYMGDYMSKKSSPELSFILNNSQPTYVPPDPFRTIGARIRLKHEAKQAGGDV